MRLSKSGPRQAVMTAVLLIAFAALATPSVSAAGVYNFTEATIEIEYCLNATFICTIFQIDTRKLEPQQSWSSNEAPSASDESTSANRAKAQPATE